MSQNKKCMYIFPMSKVENMEETHPYIYSLCSSLSKNFEIINYGNKSDNLIRDLSKYFFKTDIFSFNWLENGLSKKHTILFIVFIFLSKIFRKKIVWTHHNVHPHNSKRKL